VCVAVLDAFRRPSGDIVCWTRGVPACQGLVHTRRAWMHPVSSAAGERIRFRLSGLRDDSPGGGQGIHS
jgi:hypothetical protein